MRVIALMMRHEVRGRVKAPACRFPGAGAQRLPTSRRTRDLPDWGGRALA